MSVRVQLDNPHGFYTNLDFISGKVVLSLTNDENVSGITVKVEGESRTILMRPTGPQYQQSLQMRQQQRQGVATENHKILYRVAQVFPSNDAGASAGMAYTLRAGVHEYPFRIKIPFNNGCSDPRQAQLMGPGGSSLGGFGLQAMQQMQYRHVKRTLPPSLTGFPGEAEIRYYVKVTVQRPSIFKENRRSAIGFRFMPIEPPRAEPTQNEVYARRPFQFQAGLTTFAKKGPMFKKKPKELSDNAPKGEVDARLPSPAVLTCSEPLPLRLIVRKLNESPETVFLTSLQVSLFGTTEVRAQDVARTETSTWVLVSSSGLSIPLVKPEDKLRDEIVVDKTLWDRIPLPNTVAPSFATCNLTRRYELEVRVGLGYGHPGEIQPQNITLPLRFQIEIYSGIKPPASLLEAIAAQPSSLPIHSTANPPRPVPARPGADASTAPTYDPAYPPQVGAPGAPPVDDAPPSYEDAMAEDVTLSPADGPRREYSGVTDVNAPGLDEKGAAPRYSAQQGNPGPGGAGSSGGGGEHSAVI